MTMDIYKQLIKGKPQKNNKYKQITEIQTKIPLFVRQIDKDWKLVNERKQVFPHTSGRYNFVFFYLSIKYL